MDIFTSLKEWGFSKVFIINSHGDSVHTEVIEQVVKESKEKISIDLYYMGNLNMHVENAPMFPAEREGRFQPDIHAGAIETATMYAFYPYKVNTEIASKLKPQNSFDPLAYCGDPASFNLENEVIEFLKADVELDSLKIEALVKGKR